MPTSLQTAIARAIRREPPKVGAYTAVPAIVRSPEYRWDDEAQCWKDKDDRCIPESETRRLLVLFLDDLAEGLGKPLQAIADSLGKSGKFITAKARAVSKDLANAYAGAYAAGRGVPPEKLTQLDKANITNLLARENQYLQSFLDDIEAGNLSPAQIKDRARRYAVNAESAYHTGKHAKAQARGYTVARRSLTAGHEHCPDCPRYDTAGRWLPIGSVVPPTVACRCRANCKCRIEYR